MKPARIRAAGGQALAALLVACVLLCAGCGKEPEEKSSANEVYYTGKNFRGKPSPSDNGAGGSRTVRHGAE